MPPAARERYTRATAYHTAYVMGFLCALMLRRGAPALHPEVPCLPGRVWPELLDLVDPARGHWLSVFEALSDSDKHSLTAFLADTAVVQAIAGRDYARVSKVLAVADQGGVSGPLQ